MEHTGWSREKTIEKMEAALTLIGVDTYHDYFYKEYFMFNMYNMTEEEQKRVAIFYHSKKISDRYMADSYFAKILKNKEKST